jgi:hypothetical protein
MFLFGKHLPLGGDRCLHRVYHLLGREYSLLHEHEHQALDQPQRRFAANSYVRSVSGSLVRCVRACFLFTYIRGVHALIRIEQR